MSFSGENDQCFAQDQSLLTGIGEGYEDVIGYDGELRDTFHYSNPLSGYRDCEYLDDLTATRTESFPAYSECSFETKLSYSSSWTSATTVDSQLDGTLDFPDQNAAAFDVSEFLNLDVLEPASQFTGLEETTTKVSPHTVSEPVPIKRRKRRTLSSPNRRPDGSSWMNYEYNGASGKLVPSASSTSMQRRMGRHKPLSPESREHAAKVRKMRACSNCRERKAKCGIETPCKPCVDLFKCDLISHPCRNRFLADWTDMLLSEDLCWHPTPRNLDTFLGAGCYTVGPADNTVLLSWGFGPPMRCRISVVHPLFTHQLYHTHVVYEWPPRVGSANYQYCTQAVLPIVLSQVDDLSERIDQQMTNLVESYFHQFPHVFSDLRVLRVVYQYYRNLRPPHSHILQLALKLLVLVHTGGEITVSKDDPTVHMIMCLLLSSPPTPTTGPPMPCFIRGQLGRILPALARSYLHDILESLESIALSKACTHWPIVLATLAVLLMAVESVQYQAARVPMHALFKPPASTTAAAAAATAAAAERDERASPDDGVAALIAFYRNCFPTCHRRLQAYDDDERLGAGTAAEAGLFAQGQFVQEMKVAIGRGRAYIEGRRAAASWGAGWGGGGGDISLFFDKHLATLLAPA